MTIKDSLHLFKSELAEIYESDELESMSYIVFEHLLGYSRITVNYKREEQFSADTENSFLNILKELKTKKPLQYVLGETEFYGLTFKVNSNVLIPRQETEELVDWIIKDVKKSGRSDLKIIDIGTGSGCIPVSLKVNLPDAEISAVDISKGALEVAKGNAYVNGVTINFIEQDILSASAIENLPSADIIVSNPPYVRNSEKELMHGNVLDFEPHLALFVDDSEALIFYETIADLALQKLRAAGRLYFEINEAKGDAVCKMLEQKGFFDIILRKDLSDKDRMIRCTK